MKMTWRILTEMNERKITFATVSAHSLPWRELNLARERNCQNPEAIREITASAHVRGAQRGNTKLRL